MSGLLFPRCLRWSSLFAAAALVWCGAVGARTAAQSQAEGTRPELRRKVDRLVAELEAETRSARTAARESLLALGPSILPLLPDERTIASAAARDALGEIRLRLERQSAWESLAASRVSLQGRFRLAEILHRFTNQTGNRFDLEAVDASLLIREFTIDDQSRTFWSACDDLLRKANLAYAPVHKPGTLKLLPASQAPGGGETAVALSGPFRVAVRSAELRSVAGQMRKFLRINWSLMAEPRLRPLFAAIAGNRLAVTGAGSTPFKPATPAARWELSMGEGSVTLRLDSDFEVPPGSEPASVEFRGSLGVEMAAGPQTIIFDTVRSAHQEVRRSARQETRRVGNVMVGLRHVELPAPGEKQGTARIEISLVYDQGGPAFESYRTWIYHNQAWLQTEGGKRLLPRPEVATQRQGDGWVSVEYNFADVPGTPGHYRFVYVAPTLITEVPVQFHFPQLPVARSASEGTKP